MFPKFKFSCVNFLYLLLHFSFISSALYTTYNIQSFILFYSDKITIRGSQEAVERAKAMITEKLATAKENWG